MNSSSPHPHSKRQPTQNHAHIQNISAKKITESCYLVHVSLCSYHISVYHVNCAGRSVDVKYTNITWRLKSVIITDMTMVVNIYNCEKYRKYQCIYPPRCTKQIDVIYDMNKKALQVLDLHSICD